LTPDRDDDTLAGVKHFFSVAVAFAATTSQVMGQTPDARRFASELRVHWAPASRTVTVLAQRASRRALLRALADEAKLALRLPADFADSSIDYEATEAPVQQVLDDILRGTGVGYLMTLGRNRTDAGVLLIVGTAAPTQAQMDEIQNTSDEIQNTSLGTEGPVVVVAGSPAALPDGPTDDPIVLERYHKELNGPTADDMMALAASPQAIGSAPKSLAKPRADVVTLSSPIPGRIPVGSPPLETQAPFIPLRLAAPPAAPWTPVSAEDVNGKKRN
jgi:hypothetical protein